MRKIDRRCIKAIGFLRQIIIPKPHSGLQTRRHNGAIDNSKVESSAVAEPRARARNTYARVRKCVNKKAANASTIVI